MDKTGKISCYIMIILYVLLLVPMLYIAKYSIPQADDLSYGYIVHDLLKNSRGGIIESIKFAFSNVYEYYFSWQGSFSSVFMMSLHPGTWKDFLYPITAFIMIGSLTFSTLFFCRIIFHRLCKMDIWSCRIISILWLVANTQFLYSPSQGFYWYNGSVYYTFFYSISLVLYGMIIKYIIDGNNKRRHIVFISLLCIFLGGGNYPTALMTAVILTITTLILYINKNKTYKTVMLFTIIFVTAFMLSVIAPGNAVRQASCEGLTAVEAICKSIFYAMIELMRLCVTPTIFLIIMSMPLLWNGAKNSNFSFRYPLLFTGIVFSVYAVQFCPTLYAAGTLGNMRVRNIEFFSAVFTFMITCFYWIGWLVGNKEKIAKRIEKTVANHVKKFYMVTIILAIISCYVVPSITAVPVSYTCCKAIMDGSARRYYEEHIERVREVESASDNEVVELHELTEKPYPLYFNSLKKESDFWINRSFAQYYSGKKIKITVK